MMTVKPACLQPAMAARRFRRLGRGFYGGHAARLSQRIGKIRLRSRRRLALRILLHRHQIADGLTAALLLALLLANLSGGGFRADGLPDQLQIRAPRPQRLSASIATAAASSSGTAGSHCMPK